MTLSKRILIIDDDEMNLQIARMILERKLDCEVICADSGVDGLEILRKQRINLVLLDVLMPDFDGIETLAEIRADEKISRVPVMMLTASGDFDNVRRAAQLGAKDYIKKPFMPADLIARVKEKLDESAAKEILIVSDDETELQRMKSLIEENFSHEVLTATADAAIKILHSTEPALIIAGANMKFINGFKLLKFLSDDEKFSGVPFAVTTATKLLELVEKISPEIEEPPTESADEKKRLANVVTNLIGYELDVRV